MTFVIAFAVALVIAGLIRKYGPKGEPTYTADSWEDVPPVGGE